MWALGCNPTAHLLNFNSSKNMGSTSHRCINIYCIIFMVHRNNMINAHGYPFILYVENIINK